VKGLASTAERTHNQSDALTQPQEPTAPIPSQPSSDASLSGDTAQANESTVEAETTTEGDGETDTATLDDLLRIEGIGPKVSTIVVAAGITTFAELADTAVERLQAILDEAGIHTANPSTWPEQAHLAAQAKWDELNQLQERIKNGQLEA
jgi:predicted flap endonuclease-1-like 5' DNA nuclease